MTVARVMIAAFCALAAGIAAENAKASQTCLTSGATAPYCQVQAGTRAHS
jgi:hypothetical protein